MNNYYKKEALRRAITDVAVSGVSEMGSDTQLPYNSFNALILLAKEFINACKEEDTNDE